MSGGKEFRQALREKRFNVAVVVTSVGQLNVGDRNMRSCPASAQRSGRTNRSVSLNPLPRPPVLLREEFSCLSSRACRREWAGGWPARTGFGLPALAPPNLQGEA